MICWLSQAPFVLQDADARFYRRFIRSLSRQVRYLRRNANDTREGLPRLQAVIALNYAHSVHAGAVRDICAATYVA